MIRPTLWLVAGALCCASGKLTNSPAYAADVISIQEAAISPESVFRFSFQAQAGEKYSVGTSPDLTHWSVLTNAVGNGALLTIEDTHLKADRRFYQIGIPGNTLPIPPTNMVLISPGSFVMGSPDSEAGRDAVEGPQTIVRLSRSYWIGKYEVTQAEYVSLMGSNISAFVWSSQLPVDFSLWSHATNYCYQLTLHERAAGRLPAGWIYRLPTEAEWEYACRAGTTTPFGVGNGNALSSMQANFDGTFPYGGASRSTNLNYTQLVGSYAPNAWGIYDMHGNVWEWCQDWYGPYPGGRVTDPKGPATGKDHVLRGGAFDSVGKQCRSAKRDHRDPTYKNTIQGFRVVLAQDP